MVTLAELRALAEQAEAVSPGEWYVRRSNPPLPHDRTVVTGGASTGVGMTHAEVARYIAALSPEVVKALVAVAEAAETTSRSCECSVGSRCPQALVRAALDALKAVLR